MKRNARLLVAAVAAALLLASLCGADARAQGERADRFDFYTRGPYRENVPRPQSILRYDVGDFHTNYAMMERVITAIAQAAPDRVRVYDIGLTNEYRMQHVVAISAPENIARLDELKANMKRLSDPRALAGGRGAAARLFRARPRVARLHDPRQRVGVVRGDDAGRLPARRVERAGDARHPEEQRGPHQRLLEPRRPRALRHVVQLVRQRQPRPFRRRARRAVVGLRSRQPLPLRPEPRQRRHVAGRDAQPATRLPRMEPAGRRRSSRPALAVLLPARGPARQPEPAARADRALARRLRSRQRRAVRPAPTGTSTSATSSTCSTPATGTRGPR